MSGCCIIHTDKVINIVQLTSGRILVNIVFMSMLPLQILFAAVFSVSTVVGQPPARMSGSGLLVWNYLIRDKTTKKLVVAVPPDSIYYHKGYAIEILLKTNDLTNLDGKTTISVLPNGYHFIDIPKKRFCKVNDLQDIPGNIGNSWQPFEKKNLGISFRFKHYNGEKYTVKDTVIDRRPFQLIRYTVAAGTHKGAMLTLYAERGAESPIPFYSLEAVLKGRLHRISIVYPDGGEAIMRYDYIELSPSTPQFQIIEKAIKSGL